jgi:hypothetical protein
LIPCKYVLVAKPMHNLQRYNNFPTLIQLKPTSIQLNT